MAISNIDSYRINPIKNELQASKNYNDCMTSLNSLNNLGKNEHMLTNIDVMKEKFKQLKENESIKESDLTYIQIYDTINQAMQIQLKQNKSFEDIANFYSTYQNFIDICNRVR